MKTFNDEVDAIFGALYQHVGFRRYMDAIFDVQAVEGSTVIDDVLAAMMIRDYARLTDKHLVADKQLAAIIRALHVVMRRYGIDRKHRERHVFDADFYMRDESGEQP